MIHFVVSARHAKVIRAFHRSWGKELAGMADIWCYEFLPLGRPLPAGVWIFTDMERLLAPEMRLAAEVADHMAGHPGSYTVLNHPGKWADRFALQKLLAGRGINDFRTWSVEEVGPQVRYPVFLRQGKDHNGSLTGLLGSEEELREELRRLNLRNRILKRRLMVIEYLDTADEGGVFRKYSAMRLGSMVVARHVLFSTKWVTKNPDVVHGESVREEEEFLATFPHEEEVREIFRLGGVDYGRIDYGIKDGRLQVWEINTNPVVVPPEPTISTLRIEGQRASAATIIAGMRSLAVNAPGEVCGEAFPRGRRVRGKMVQALGMAHTLLRK